MKRSEFYVGQRVQQKDPDEECMAYGHVKEIKEKSIIIKWEDLNENTEHFDSEFDTIKRNPS